MIYLFAFFVGFGFSDARNYGPNVTAPTRFDIGDYMTSNNSQYHAIMQVDGNFVIYRGTLADRPDDARWRTKTDQHSNGPYHIDLQGDNNFVLYDFYQMPIWHAKVKKGTPPARLALQDDGNLVLKDISGKKLWTSEGDLKGRANRKVTKKPKKTNGWD